METKTGIRDKFSKDILTDIDKSRNNILQDTDPPPGSYTKNLIAYFNKLGKESSKNEQSVFQHTLTTNDSFQKEPDIFGASPLIGQRTTRNLNPKHRNINNLPQDYTYKNISSRDSGNELKSDCDLEKISPEMKKERLGAFSYTSNGAELTLSNVSGATAACIQNEDQSPQEVSCTQSNKPKISETTKQVREDQETTTGTRQKTKIYWSGNKQKIYSRNSEIRNSGRKKPREKIETLKNESSNKFYTTSNSEENYEDSYLKENFSSYSPNGPRKLATNYHETSHAKVNTDRGKITYIRGQKVESSCVKVHKGPESNIAWRNNICDFVDTNDEEIITSYDTKGKKYYRDDVIPHYHDKGKKLSNADMMIGYEESKSDIRNSSRFKNRNNSKKCDIKQSHCIDQETLSKNIPIQCDEIAFRGKTNEQCIWQSLNDKFKKPNFDKVDNISQNKNSTFKGNNRNQKILDTEHNEKHNGQPVKVYDPRYDPLRGEFTAEFIRKSSSDKLRKSNHDKLDNNLQNEISPFKNNHSQKIFDIEDHEEKHNVKPSKAYYPKYEFLKDESTAQFNRQSSTHQLKKSEFDKLDNNSQNKIYTSKNNHSQKIFDIDNSDEKDNVKPVKVYDPQHHRLSRKKTVIAQYSEYMKLKNSLSPNPQIKRIEISNTTSGGSMNEDLKENFEFFKNPNLNKPHKENKSFMDDVLSYITITNSGASTKITSPFENSPPILKSNAKKHLKSSIIRNGKEIADLMVFCERDFDTFKSVYNQWIDFRKQTISLLEQIVMIINQSPRKNDTMKHVITAINITATVTKLIPHPAASMGAKVADAFGGFLSNFINRADCKEDVKAKEFEIKELFQRDMDSSSDVYIYGVQCSSQFQETSNAITKFHGQLLTRDYQSFIDNDELLDFMNELTEYNSTNTHVFYKRLRMCYEKLIKCSNSEESRAFIRVFEDVPEAVSVIDLLPWKFNSDGFDNSIVQSSWDELFILFQDGNQTTSDAILKKIQNCLFFLKKEHVILTLNMRNLFKDTVK